MSLAECPPLLRTPERRAERPAELIARVGGELREEYHHAFETDKESETLRSLTAQLLGFLRQVSESNRKYTPEDTEFLATLYEELMVERSRRAEEVESPEVQTAANIANSLCHYPWYMQDCVDGRVNPTLVLMMIAGMRGGAIQTPAGDSNDYVQSRTGDLMVRSGSNIEKQIKRAFETQDEICEVLDSHLACAAKNEECNELGHPTDDGGLYEDVLRKRGIAEALRAHVEANHPGKTVLPVQISFDPHSGYMFMGLETNQAMQAALAEGQSKAEKRGENGITLFGCFSDEVLTQLAQEGKTISTKLLVEEEPFQTLFAQAYEGFEPKPDWREGYKDTAHQCWLAIKGMRPRVMPTLLQKLKAIPDFASLPEKELEDRAMMVLTNAFNAFCNNYGKEHYPFGEHDERFVSVTERDYRPCHNTGFAVYALDHANLSRRVAFAASIVRKNRKAGRIKDNMYRSVPVIAKEILREELPESEWATLRSLNWSFLQATGQEAANWYTMNDDEFEAQLLGNNSGVSISARALRALKNLRKTMIAMYDPNKPSSEQLLSGKMTALPVISDGSRRFRVIVPFVLNGF